MHTIIFATFQHTEHVNYNLKVFITKKIGKRLLSIGLQNVDHGNLMLMYFIEPMKKLHTDSDRQCN